MEQTVIQIGNSAGVIIPKQLRQKMNIKLGNKVKLEQVPGHDAIVVHFQDKIDKGANDITLEFYVFLKQFIKRYGHALRELAKH